MIYHNFNVYNDRMMVPVGAHIIAIILLFQIILIGKFVTTFPFNSLYWSDVNLGDAPWAARPYTRWTNYGLCDSDMKCSVVRNAFPYDPITQLALSKHLKVVVRYVPVVFYTRRNQYCLATKTAFSLYIVGLVFSMIALFSQYLFSFRSRIIFALVYLFKVLAFIFTGVGAILTTTAHCKGVSHLIGMGYDAKVGIFAQFYIWGATLFAFAALAYSYVRPYHPEPIEHFEEPPAYWDPPVENNINTTVYNTTNNNNVENSNNTTTNNYFNIHIYEAAKNYFSSGKS